MSQSGLLEDLFVLPAIVRRHQNAPLMPEREAFLLHLHQRGTGQSNLRNYAGLLNQIISATTAKEITCDHTSRNRRSGGELER